MANDLALHSLLKSDCPNINDGKYTALIMCYFLPKFIMVPQQFTWNLKSCTDVSTKMVQLFFLVSLKYDHDELNALHAG